MDRVEAAPLPDRLRLHGLRACRVGEARAPGPNLFVLNCGGAPGAWRLRNEGFLRAHVVFLQEVAMSVSEWDAFARVAFRDGYYAYHVSGGFRSNGIPRGGVATLVHKSINHRLAASVSHKGTQFLALWVSRSVWVNFYTPPEHAEVGVEALGSLWGSLALDLQSWVLAGDANQLASDGVLGRFLSRCPVW